MKVLGTILAATLYAIGWVFGIVAVAVKWLWSAIALGYADAHRYARRGHAPRELRAVPDTDTADARPVPRWPAEVAR